MSGLSGEPVLALSGAHYAYPGGAVALTGASLTVHARESVAILGANGCGKSTLLMVLAGLCYPNPGTLTAFGEPITEERLRDDRTAWWFRRRVGIVFQNADAQLFCSTVREELAFGPLQLGLPADEVERRTRDIAAMLRLGPLLDRPPFRLSGGEKRKVALASVLAVNPHIILLDEPTAGLDPRTQQWLIETLQTLQAAGKTLVTATHDLEVVPDIAQRAVVMNEAHAIETEGDPCTVLADRDLLLRVNLIHEHSHYHGDALHSHAHTHYRDHEHDH